MPEELIDQVDAPVGPERRSALAIEIALREFRKRALLALLKGGEAAYNYEDHPEFIYHPFRRVKVYAKAIKLRIPSCVNGTLEIESYTQFK